MTTITVLYTHNIKGDLQMLPRMMTVLRRLKDEAASKVLLLDLGNSCLPEVWPCGVTGGRSTLMVLDAMAFHAANVSWTLTTSSREKLVKRVSLAVLDEVNPSHVQDEVLLTITPQNHIGGLQIVLAPGEETKMNDAVGVRHAVPLQGRALYLQTLESGQIGVARVDGDTVQAEIVAVPANTQPDPTISGVVELVIDEARYFEEHRR